MSQLKILTYNTWHGLNGKGTIEFGLLEPKGRKQLRQKWQIQELRSLDADLLFLQEVCPLREYSERLARHLQMDEVHQLDQGGLKILGRGIPRNLSTGLTILAKRKYALNKLAAVKLSGGKGSLSDWVSFQYNEFRYALFAEIETAGGLILLVNTHLHHAPIQVKEITKRLKDLHDAGRVSGWQKERFAKAIQKGNERRQAEMSILLSEIRKIRGQYQLVILCGDLNDLSSSVTLEETRENGFQDVIRLDKSNDPQYFSWNYELNAINHSWTQHLNPPFPCYGNPFLEELFRDIDRKPRRIDYILLAGNAKADRVNLSMHEAKPLNQKGEAFIGSDHFGVLAEIKLQF